MQSPRCEREARGRDFSVLFLGLDFYCIIPSESRKTALRAAKTFLVFMTDSIKVRNTEMDKNHCVISLRVRFLPSIRQIWAGLLPRHSRLEVKAREGRMPISSLQRTWWPEWPNLLDPHSYALKARGSTSQPIHFTEAEFEHNLFLNVHKTYLCFTQDGRQGTH